MNKYVVSVILKRVGHYHDDQDTHEYNRTLYAKADTKQEAVEKVWSTPLKFDEGSIMEDPDKIYNFIMKTKCYCAPFQWCFDVHDLDEVCWFE